MTAPSLMGDFRDELLRSGMLVDAGSPGLYHRSAGFEAIVAGVSRLAHEAGKGDAAQRHHFAPMMPRHRFVETDYLRSFPDLIGSVHSFRGSDRDHAALLRTLDAGQDWAGELVPTDLVLCSAICHSLYPLSRGLRLPAAGELHECAGTAFRHEPSLDPARMQSFRMLEFVWLGGEQDAVEHRDRWMDRGTALLAGLGLEVVTEVANDPFFGRVGQMLAADQRSRAGKFEITAPISGGSPTAIASGNCHGDHFGVNFAITTADGAPAHSSCFGFGLERIALALLARHGSQLEVWPESVRLVLWPAGGGAWS